MGERSSNPRKRLAVVLSHPTQYFSPWFQYIVENSEIDLKVFYLWEFGVQSIVDRNFGHALKWDIPLLQGYEYEFIPNSSNDPGTHHFFGLNNPELVPALAAWRPDIILLFGYNYLSHLRVLMSWSLRKIPMLQRGDSHDLSRTLGWKASFKRYLRSLLFKRFSAFLSVGKANAEYLLNSGVPQKRISFAPHCVDNQRFQLASAQAEIDAAAWRQELGIDPEARVMLFAGKFEINKRPMDLVKAFKLALNRIKADTKNAKAVLLLVGAGELKSALCEFAAEDLDTTIFFAGFQNQSQMPKVYALGDILVLPSANESWGLAINEAMNLSSVVVVSSQVGCAPDLVVNGETGWVFSAGNIDELAAILQEAIAMRRCDLDSMGHAAFERVQLYSYESARKSLIDTIAVTLQRKT
jgi:glycosyltransferase involved in cell wall biosynthesis